MRWNAFVVGGKTDLEIEGWGLNKLLIHLPKSKVLDRFIRTDCTGRTTNALNLACRITSGGCVR
eukprot:2730202-Rhodomonas_salina.4